MVGRRDGRYWLCLDGVHEDQPEPHVNRYSVGDNRVDIVLDDGATRSILWPTKNERMGLIDVAGLELEALYGGFAGEPFTDDSREYVFVARKSPSRAATSRRDISDAEVTA